MESARRHAALQLDKLFSHDENYGSPGSGEGVGEVEIRETERNGARKLGGKGRVRATGLYDEDKLRKTAAGSLRGAV